MKFVWGAWTVLMLAMATVAGLTVFAVLLTLLVTLFDRVGGHVILGVGRLACCGFRYLCTGRRHGAVADTAGADDNDGDEAAGGVAAHFSRGH